MVYRIANLIRKEFIQVSRDRVLAAFLLLAPILELALLAQATGQEIRNRPFAVLDLDRQAYSRRLVAAMDNTETLTLCCTATDYGDIERLLHSGQAELALLIPRGFSNRLLDRSSPAVVQLVADATNQVAAVTALSAAEGALAQTARIWAASGGVVFAPERVDLRTIVRYNPTLNSRHYTVPAQIGFIVLQVTLAVAAVSLAREREVGTLEQLLIAPLRRREIILGKAVAPVVIGLLDFSVMLTIALFVFAVPMRGSLALLSAITLLFVMAESSWGLVLSTFAATQQQAVLFVFVQCMLDITFSGYLVPVDNLPFLLRVISSLVPMRHYLEVIRSIMLKATPAELLWRQIAALVGIGLAFSFVAALNLSRRLE